MLLWSIVYALLFYNFWNSLKMCFDDIIILISGER